MYFYLFTCWAIGIISIIIGTNAEAWLAASFVISCLIDLRKEFRSLLLKTEMK